MVYSNDKLEQGYGYMDLVSPDTGIDTHAFHAFVILTATPTSTQGPSLLVNSDNTTNTSREGFFEVIFAKNNVLEVLRLSGQGANYTTLQPIAETAYTNIR